MGMTSRTAIIIINITNTVRLERGGGSIPGMVRLKEMNISILIQKMARRAPIGHIFKIKTGIYPLSKIIYPPMVFGGLVAVLGK